MCAAEPNHSLGGLATVLQQSGLLEELDLVALGLTAQCLVGELLVGLRHFGDTVTLSSTPLTTIATSAAS